MTEPSGTQRLIGRERVRTDAESRGVQIEFVERGPASSLPEAAANLGLEPRDIVKTLVAKAKLTQTAAEHSYVIVLIPGDKAVDWAKLRKLAGMKKMSMASPEEGFEVTGYRPGTINPFGTVNPLPVYADESISGRIAMGAGEDGLNLFVEAAQLFGAFKVTAGDIGK